MDDKIDKLNRKIARLLGKKGNAKPLENNNSNNGGNGNNDGGVISNRTYAIVMLMCVLLLWLATGVYYVGENTYGLVMVDGQIKKVVTGPAVGVNMPIPLGGVVLVDGAATSMKGIGLSEMNGGYVALSKDLVPLELVGQYSFKVVNSQLMYNNLEITPQNIENTVKFNLLAATHRVLAKQDYASLKMANLTILAKDIVDNANNQLIKDGLTLVKLNINRLHLAAYTETTSTLADDTSLDSQLTTKVADNLINEARSYRQDQLAKLQVTASNYNQLLKEYDNKPEAVAQQMYYDTLAYLASNSACTKYTYLFLNLSQLATQINQINASTSRDVVRARTYGR
jgi:membrane protease subunit HflK